MPFYKMTSGSGRPHLATAIDDDPVSALCGRKVSVSGWRSVTNLDGDECERCAAKTGYVKTEVGEIVPTAETDGAVKALLLELGVDGKVASQGNRLPKKRGPADT